MQCQHLLVLVRIEFAWTYFWWLIVFCTRLPNGHKQCIWSTPVWQQGPLCCDCVFIKKDTRLDGMCGLHVAQVLLFLSFTSHHILYPCALVQWFVIVGNAPCGETGMWIVKPEMEEVSTQATSIICIDSIVWGTHLIGVYGELFLPCGFSHFDSLSTFQAYYVNKFIDYHTNEIAFWNCALLLTIFYFMSYIDRICSICVLWF